VPAPETAGEGAGEREDQDGDHGVQRAHPRGAVVREDALDEHEEREHEAEQHLAAAEPGDERRDEDEQRDDEEDVPERAMRREHVVEVRVRGAALDAEDAEPGEEELDDHPEGEDGEDDAVDRAH
jgi:hypothetical protein